MRPDLAGRVAIVAAHPDDEVIGAGARMTRLHEAWVVHITDGAPLDMSDARAAGFMKRADYARTRREEALAALALAGVPESRARAFGFVDQLASFDLPAVTAALVEFMKQIPLDLVITHPYEGGHPDHDATAFAVHSACRVLAREQARPPVIVEMTSYHQSNGDRRSGEFLGDSSAIPAGGCPDVSEFRLTRRERELKRRMMECFVTQKSMLEGCGLDCERFRDAPTYDFRQPAQRGAAWYDRFNWGIASPRWRELAAHALEEMGLAEAS